MNYIKILVKTYKLITNSKLIRILGTPTMNNLYLAYE